jgi:3-ketosteroid 9alpha-monooxygenase subunit A
MGRDTFEQTALPPYTGGWFQMGWSDDLPKGALRGLRHFGRSYVMFRARDGNVGILDDVCPHLGAHFSEGGQVVGNAVRCPYHHWAFDRSGRCTDIPYAKKIPAKACTRAHTVVERYGMIFMYRDQTGGPAPYPLPEIEGFDPAAYGPPAKHDLEIRIHGQDIMENSVDSAHFAAVHGHMMPDNAFRLEGSALRVTQRTAVRRFGTTLRARLEFHLIEPGFHYVHFPEMPGPQAHVFSSIVPIDDHRVSHRLSIRIKKSRAPFVSGIARRFLLWQMMKTYREDMRIWETKKYLARPILCDGDAGIMKLRRWYAQFFDTDEPGGRRLELAR